MKYINHYVVLFLVWIVIPFLVYLHSKDVVESVVMFVVSASYFVPIIWICRKIMKAQEV